MAGLRNITFDDRDTTNLKYQGFWFLTGSWNASSVGETGTLSSTNFIGANVTFTFPTPALAFYYYGIPRSLGGQYGICIDCDPNNRIFIPIDGVNRTDDGHNPPVVLYSMTFTTPGVHEIIIINQADPRFNGNSQLTIDRIDLEVVDPTVGGGSSSSSSSAATSATQSPSGSPANSNGGSSTSSGTPVGAIVGGVLGAIAVVLALVVFAFWLRLRRRRAKAQLQSIDPSVTTYSGVPSTMQQTTLYNSSFPGSTQGGYGTGQGRHSRRNQASGHAASQPSVSTFSDATGITGVTGTTGLSYATESSSYPSTSNSDTNTNTRTGPRRERDAGPLPQAINELDEEDEGTLPPDYGDVFASRRASRPMSSGVGVAANPNDPPIAGPDDSVATSIQPVRRKS